MVRRANSQIENMVLGKLFYFNEETPEAQFDAFMSCVTKNEATPIIDPGHYLTYLDRRA
jgi:hypothetical protein